MRLTFRKTIGWCGVWFSLLLISFWTTGLAVPSRAAPGYSNSSLVDIYLAEATESIEDLQQQQKTIDQTRSGVQQEQERLQTQEQSAQEQLGGLQTRIQATAAQIAENEQKLEEANGRLKDLQKKLAVAEATYQDKQFSTVARLRYWQRQKGNQGWAVLLQSENLNEFLDRRYQLRLMYQADRKILAELRQDADDLEKQRRGVESQKNQIALITQELQTQKADYQAQAKTQQDLIKRLQADRRALEAAEEQLAKDSENLAALIQQRLAEQARQNKTAPYSTGAMGYPSGGIITSGFGYRVHPVLGYSRFHAGLDFGADYGSPIWAAKGGVVLFAGWYGGYGQAVIVDHGSGITTLYGHASELYVSEGQTVQRGQLIAAIGSTGLSTGPHLHFEVRASGEPIDPLNYL
ncbi:murein hydrolase activator EnvC family protein [Thermocoleostomius sinensis]|uniref:Peptidoglycan DD-metalloendopeptidase family protein n=1 Tax=Thermocoleostomius sinensis A174 TaxID=2016057 RepID=A0A9E9CA67_9CYAN|nr:peptidoglycan DD-metalloendopeptidase family protein [Thermocoleostomius sinensis]WAL58565.1 peptidoglycan DD-metalloendopeptidase family protein [Thermocoleostomius sinensis A174]